MVWITCYYPKFIHRKLWAANMHQPQHWMWSQLKTQPKQEFLHFTHFSLSKASKKSKNLVHYNSYYNFLSSLISGRVLQNSQVSPFLYFIPREFLQSCHLCSLHPLDGLPHCILPRAYFLLNNPWAGWVFLVLIAFLTGTI